MSPHGDQTDPDPPRGPGSPRRITTLPRAFPVRAQVPHQNILLLSQNPSPITPRRPPPLGVAVVWWTRAAGAPTVGGAQGTTYGGMKPAECGEPSMVTPKHRHQNTPRGTPTGAGMGEMGPSSATTPLPTFCGREVSDHALPTIVTPATKPESTHGGIQSVMFGERQTATLWEQSQSTRNMTKRGDGLIAKEPSSRGMRSASYCGPPRESRENGSNNPPSLRRSSREGRSGQ